MKTWQRILVFPLAALSLGLLTKGFLPDSLRPAAENPALPEFSRVTWKDTEPRVQSGEWLLVDARGEEQFRAQHIPGAISLPAHSYPEMLQFFAEDHGTAKTVVVYCDTQECDLSTELAGRLRAEIGCRDVRILDGGFLAWRRNP